MAKRTRTDIPPHLLFDLESDVFKGFNATDIRPLAHIAHRAPLFCLAPKEKRVRVESNGSHEFGLESNSSSSLNNETNSPAVEYQTRRRTSFSSSREGEISQNVFACGQSSVCNNRETGEGSSSVEGEISYTTERSNKHLPAIDEENQHLPAVDEKTKKTDAPKPDTLQRGKAKQ